MTYRAAGFVEALIAIAVAGIASIVLMGVAADTVAEVLYNEVEDEMVQTSIQGAEMVKKIADEHNKSDEALFPLITENRNSCFAFEGSVSDPTFKKDGDVYRAVCTYDTNREACVKYTTPNSEEYFTVFCLTTESDVERDLVVGKVVTGLVDCDGVEDAGKCRNDDYQYYVAIKVLQEKSSETVQEGGDYIYNPVTPPQDPIDNSGDINNEPTY